MVRDAIDDGSFKTAPEVRKNCVRVYYAAGYHVDVPVYRRVTTKDVLGDETYHHELASSDWKRSDARDVTEWFEKQNNRKSPDTDNGRQLRRIVRQIKKFARSRDSWKGQILSGFGITKLVTECFRGDADREDVALYETMKAIRDRLNINLVVAHPVTPNETITNGTDDARARFLRDRLGEAIETLAPLFEHDCTRKKALKCWDKVFATDFFSDREQMTAKAAPACSRRHRSRRRPARFPFPNAPRDRQQAAGIRLMWWLRDPDRLKREMAAIDALREHEAWLSAAVPRLLKGLKFAFEFDIVVNDETFPFTLEYPAFFPATPAARYSARRPAVVGSSVRRWRRTLPRIPIRQLGPFDHRRDDDREHLSPPCGRAPGEE